MENNTPTQFEHFAKPRTIPSGWDLSSLDVPKVASRNGKLGSKASQTGTDDPAMEEIRFSEWQLDPYFDQPVENYRGRMAAY